MMPTATTSDPIPLCEPLIGDREREWVNRCFDTGFVSTVGRLVSEFEQQFAGRVGAAHAVATASGTAALHVALRLAGVGKGDGVAVQDLTFVASVNPALYLHADPIPVDVDPSTWTLDVALLERFFEEEPERAARIKAVVPVHLYGCAVDMPRLMKLAARFGFKVVEDATEALGTTWRGQQVGTFGDFGCFSFNGNKLITTGAGGMIVTESAELAERARYLVCQAREPGDAYVHGTDGYNYRMTNLHAALGLAQLERLDFILERKRQIAQRYRDAFVGVEGITLPPELPGADNCNWLFSILADSANRASLLLKHLNEKQIMARPFFVPLHDQPYLTGSSCVSLNSWNSSELASRGLNLPSSATLRADQQERVIDQVLRFIQS